MTQAMRRRCVLGLLCALAAGHACSRAGDAPAEVRARLERDLLALPAGEALPAPAGVKARMPRGREVEIVQKETRATASQAPI